jgi:hypothetical protein
MPEKWENKAKELGALAREREIKSAFDFLWMAFLSMAEGGILSRNVGVVTACRHSLIKRESGVRPVSKNRGTAVAAVRTHMLEQSGDSGGAVMGGRRRTGAQERRSGLPMPHRATRPFDLGMKGMAAAGAGFKTFGERGVMTGGRAYNGKQEVECLLGRWGGFAFRFGRKRFHVYDRRGRRAGASGRFKGSRPRQTRSR